MLFGGWATLKHFSHKLKKPWSTQDPPYTYCQQKNPFYLQRLKCSSKIQQLLSQPAFGQHVGV